MKFKIGDKVVITNPGKRYTTYSEKFEFYKFKNTKCNDLLELTDNNVWTVFDTPTRHSYYDPSIVVPIESSTGKQLLIDETGLEFAEISSEHPLIVKYRIFELQYKNKTVPDGFGYKTLEIPKLIDPELPYAAVNPCGSKEDAQNTIFNFGKAGKKYTIVEIYEVDENKK